MVVQEVVVQEVVVVVLVAVLVVVKMEEELGLALEQLVELVSVLQDDEVTVELALSELKA